MKRRLGPMRERVAFDAPVKQKDAYHGTIQGFGAPEDAIERWAEFRFQRGDEGDDAGRLSARARFKLRLHQSAALRAITEAWRMRDLRTGAAYQIRSIDKISDRDFIWIEVESGVGIG